MSSLKTMACAGYLEDVSGSEHGAGFAFNPIRYSDSE